MRDPSLLQRWLGAPSLLALHERPRPSGALHGELVPRPEHFRHESEVHGQRHVARVTVHAFRLLAATGNAGEATPLWGAVYLHDLARTHDGVCHRHGADAWTRFERDAALRQHLEAGGVTTADHDAIRTAITHHCRGELDMHHAHYRLTALLKDADGLDRVRLGDLDPRYLRHPEARQMVAFAEALFGATDDLPQGGTHFDEVLRAAAALEEGGGRASPRMKGRS